MKEETLREHLEEFKDNNSRYSLLELLKNCFVEELEQVDSVTDGQKHDLNLLIREFEEELDWIESEKLSEFDPERQ